MLSAASESSCFDILVRVAAKPFLQNGHVQCIRPNGPALDKGQRGTASLHQAASRQAWWNDPSGSGADVHQVRGQPIEFEKGKAGIAVPSKDKLPTVIDTLI